MYSFEDYFLFFEKVEENKCDTAAAGVNIADSIETEVKQARRVEELLDDQYVEDVGKTIKHIPNWEHSNAPICSEQLSIYRWYQYKVATFCVESHAHTNKVKCVLQTPLLHIVHDIR